MLEDTFLFISHTTNVLLFKFRCNIFIGVRIIKEMPGSVVSGTHCICGTSAWNLVHFVFMGPRFFRLLLDFWKIWEPCHIQLFRFLAAYEVTPSFSSLFLHRAVSSFRLKTISLAIQPSLCDFSTSYPNDNAISMQQNTFEGEAILSKVPQNFLVALFFFQTIFSTISTP